MQNGVWFSVKYSIHIWRCIAIISKVFSVSVLLFIFLVEIVRATLQPPNFSHFHKQVNQIGAALNT